MAKKNRRESVIAVLDGHKASKHEKSVSSLTWLFGSCRLFLNDHLLVLVLLNPTFSDSWFCCFGEQQAASPWEGQGYMKFLQDQIAQQRQTYVKILRPFYDNCKNLGVKFEVKVFAGPYPKAAVASEASSFKPTLIILDRCLVDEEWVRLGCQDCQLISVDDSGKPEFHCASPDPVGSFESGTPVLSSMQEEDPNVVERAALETPECEWELDPLQLLRLPMELSSEDIGAVTDEFRVERFLHNHESVDMFKGFLLHLSGLPVLVKRFSAGNFEGIMEAEKRVSRFMFHKNIFSPIGYHEGSSFSALVYFYPGNATLDQYLSRKTSFILPLSMASLSYAYDICVFVIGVRGRPSGLTCSERMKIAIGISLGLQYMHEECPGAPVVHGDLRACTVFLGRDFQPKISGFGRARWLGDKLEATMSSSSPNSSPRLPREETLDLESLALMKADVFSFGVLLLRLFCRRPLPEDDRQLVDWARPLLLQGANHELLDHDMEELDMYEMYRVMSAATQCTKTRSFPRLDMSQVVSILRGESSSIPQSSPSSDSSMGRDAGQVF
ncbi:receptor-like cytosolic serine/threonine-protein kinase RBK1 [Aristolochia californica]|uniref:receptor-like cytosolic serine/threonine-protein kinase RBK1 n=1 Tax=Aristolochia californica TaxID=171875 RepID=UPI0035E1D608